MPLTKAHIRNFRRLKDVTIALNDSETIFIGPNNSGKTSVTTVFRKFLGQKQNFTIHDFSIELLNDFDRWGSIQQTSDETLGALPEISLDLWFSIDAKNYEYAKIAPLITSLSENVTSLGFRCIYRAKDLKDLRECFDKRTNISNSKPIETLTVFLSREKELENHFNIAYEALHDENGTIHVETLTKKAGQELSKTLVRIDFVDAQRNLQDFENYRGDKLSTVFASYYKSNVEKAGASEDAINIVEAHNKKLTDHYNDKFSGLMGALKNLGFPATNERRLSVVSKLSSDDALKGTTDIEYADDKSKYSLPEAYNGLGAKNLILIAIQLIDYLKQWESTEGIRPLTHIIFIEEPEVHLHAQAQQTFVKNMGEALKRMAKEDNMIPQLIVTTHSSHIANSVEFGRIRYFQKNELSRYGDSPATSTSTTQIKNLGQFQVSRVEDTIQDISSEEAIRFLRRYMTLTYCDLLFADAAIFVEGSSERLIVPAMIKRTCPDLNSLYFSMLEVGGAYAHIFDQLMSFLEIPYLIITDLDSVDAGTKKVCCAMKKGAVTSNSTLKYFFQSTATVEGLTKLTTDMKILNSGNCYVSFQKPIVKTIGNEKVTLLARTFEEDMIYTNIEKCGKGGFLKCVVLPQNTGDIECTTEEIFKKISGLTRKKTEFALDAMADPEWRCPSYIEEGLNWLQNRLSSNLELGGTENA